LCTSCGAAFAATPAATPALAPPTTQAAGRRGPPGCFGCLLWVIVAVVAIVGGAVVAYQNGIVTDRMILNALGQGPATVQVANLREDEITVRIEELERGDGGSPLHLAPMLGPFDVTTQTLERPGRYRVELSAGSTKIATCTLTVRSGDEITFGVLTRDAVIARGDASSDPRDAVVSTSSYCR
jgi:hypothetical protein